MNKIVKWIATGAGRAVLGVGWRTTRKRWIKEHPRCAACGYEPAKGSNDVHHILPRHKFPDLITDPDNLITLCRKYHCHLRFGHYGNYRKYWNATVRKHLGNMGFWMGVEEKIHKDEVNNA